MELEKAKVIDVRENCLLAAMQTAKEDEDVYKIIARATLYAEWILEDFSLPLCDGSGMLVDAL